MRENTGYHLMNINFASLTNLMFLKLAYDIPFRIFPYTNSLGSAIYTLITGRVISHINVLCMVAEAELI